MARVPNIQAEPRRIQSRRSLEERPSITILSAPNLGALPGIVQGFSTRVAGCSTAYGGKQLNLGFTSSDSRAAVERNRRAFLRALTSKTRRKTRKLPVLVTLRQVHSGLVHILCAGDPVTSPLIGDGLVTDRKGILLGAQVADCVPVLVADAHRGAVGIFHAGWRGTAKRIVERGVGTMRAVFRSRVANLYAAIGPSIHHCCYAVGQEVVDEFESQFLYSDQLFCEVYDRDPIKEKYPLLFLTARAPGHSNIGPQIHLDLVAANLRQLLDAGLPRENIWTAEECTSCRIDLFFSHRGEAGYTGRMMAVIGISPETD